MTPKALREMCEQVLRDDNAPYGGPDDSDMRMQSAACAAPILARALLDRLSGEAVTDRNAVIEDSIERAEQACRYVAKHNETATAAEERESDYYKGFFVACRVCEKAIREHVERHLKSPT